MYCTIELIFNRYSHENWIICMGCRLVVHHHSIGKASWSAAAGLSASNFLGCTMIGWIFDFTIVIGVILSNFLRLAGRRGRKAGA